MANDPRARLEALGTSDVPPLGEARLRSIEDRVMAATTQRHSGRRRAVMLTVAAALVGVLAVGIALATAERGDVRLDLADGVTLDLPDEVPGPGAAGDRLPDGTIIAIADGGRAVIGDRRYGPGRYAVVDGEVETLADQDQTADSTTTTTTPPDVPGPTRPAGVNDAPESTSTSTAPATRTLPTSTQAPPDEQPPVDRTIPRRDGERPATTSPRPADRPTGTAPPTTTRPDRPTTTAPTDRRRPLAPTPTAPTPTAPTPTTIRDAATTSTTAAARNERSGDRP